MPVDLLPPRTSSCATWDGVTTPVYTAPRYLRTAGGTYWHRPRSGVARPRGIIFNFWCGAGHVRLEEALTCDTAPEPDPVCGTCVGRALGAGQDDTPPGMPRIAFEPRWLNPPAECPGSGGDAHWGLYVQVGRSVGRCLVCQDIHVLRAHGSPYTGGYGPVRHQPGPGLYEPCPFHAWNFPQARPGDTVGCRCGWGTE